MVDIHGLFEIGLGRNNQFIQWNTLKARQALGYNQREREREGDLNQSLGSRYLLISCSGHFAKAT